MFLSVCLLPVFLLLLCSVRLVWLAFCWFSSFLLLSYCWYNLGEISNRNSHISATVPLKSGVQCLKLCCFYHLIFVMRLGYKLYASCHHCSSPCAGWFCLDQVTSWSCRWPCKEPGGGRLLFLRHGGWALWTIWYWYQERSEAWDTWEQEQSPFKCLWMNTQLDKGLTRHSKGYSTKPVMENAIIFFRF